MAAKALASLSLAGAACFLLQGCGSGGAADVASMQSVSQKFFDCCEAGKGWKGCSQYVTGEDAPFSAEAVDALPGPPITKNKSVKDYLDWMAGVKKEFGDKATVSVKATVFDESTNTAMFYAVFMGYSDYVYSIKVDATQNKVSGLVKVWNDQYAFNNIPGPPSTQQRALAARSTRALDAAADDSDKMASLAQDFFDCCEAGKGWAGCGKYVKDGSDKQAFGIEAVDALPGPKVTDQKSVKDYLNWMQGVKKEFGAKATVTVKAHGVNTKDRKAMYYAVFMGYSDYVYIIDICADEMKVCGLTKVWNDEYAFKNIPKATQMVESAATQGTALWAVALLIGLAVASSAVYIRQRREIKPPSALLG